MPAIKAVREYIQTEEFDYLQLLDSISAYRKPRDAITRLLKTQSINGGHNRIFERVQNS